MELARLAPGRNVQCLGRFGGGKRGHNKVEGMRRHGTAARLMNFDGRCCLSVPWPGPVEALSSGSDRGQQAACAPIAPIAPRKEPPCSTGFPPFFSIPSIPAVASAESAPFLLRLLICGSPPPTPCSATTPSTNGASLYSPTTFIWPGFWARP